MPNWALYQEAESARQSIMEQEQETRVLRETQQMKRSTAHSSLFTQAQKFGTRKADSMTRTQYRKFYIQKSKKEIQKVDLKYYRVEKKPASEKDKRETLSEWMGDD